MFRSASILLAAGLAAAPASAVTLMDGAPIAPPPVLDAPAAPLGTARGHEIIRNLENNGIGFGVLYSGADGGPVAANVPSLPANAAVPEPASWALMIAGFAGLGLMLRRRANGTTASLSR